MANHQITGQIPIEGVGEHLVLELDKQHTFAGIARPEFWGVEPRALSETDYKDMQLMAPERLRPDLVVAGRVDRPCAVGYKDEYNRTIHVSLTPAEYGLISRNVTKVGQASLNRTLASRPKRADFGLDVEAADRAGVHTLESYIDKMERYTTQTIEPDIKMLDHFAEYIKNRGLNRLRGDNFRLNVEWIREHIFGDTFEALRQQRHWTPAQELRAKNALDARLFLDRAGNRHIGNWKEMIAFEREYWGFKWALFKTKTEEAKRYVARNG